MLHQNITLLLISMSQLSNRNSSSLNETEYIRLVEMLQRLNINLTHNELAERLLNDSKQIHFGLKSYSNLEPKQDDSEFIEEVALSLWIVVLLYMMYTLICLLGVCGNTLVCYVVARNQTMHTVTNIFIANLALSDILLCIFAVPFTPLYLLAFKSWVFGTVLCHLLPFAQGKHYFFNNQ